MDVLNIKKGGHLTAYPNHSKEEWRNACIQTTQDCNAATFPRYAAPSYCTLVVACGKFACRALNATNQGSRRRPKATSALNSFRYPG